MLIARNSLTHIKLRIKFLPHILFGQYARFCNLAADIAFHIMV